MEQELDLYQILQVSPQADQKAINAAYIRLSKQYHPDLNKSPDATTRMVELNAAYEILGDTELRAAYDRRRAEPPPASPRANPYASPGGPKANPYASPGGPKANPFTPPPRPRANPYAPPRRAYPPYSRSPHRRTRGARGGWGTIGMLIMLLITLSRFAGMASTSSLPFLNSSAPIPAAPSISRAFDPTARNQFPVGSRQIQETQHACRTAYATVFTYLDGRFVPTNMTYQRGDEVEVYGRVDPYSYLGVDESQTPYYVETKYLCS